MADESVLDDPTASLTESEEANADIVPDVDGIYTRIVWLGDEKERVQRFLAASIRKTLKDYVPLLEKRNKNKAAYEGLSEQGENITLPWCRTMTNQQHAWLIDTVYSREPLLTVDALGDRKFQIVVKDEDGQYGPVDVTSQDEAEGIGALLEYKWRRRLPMRRVLSDWAMEALQDGSFPALTKIIYDPQTAKLTDHAAPTMATDAEGKPVKNKRGQRIQIRNSPEFRTVVKGESVQIVTVPGEDFLKPLSAPSIDAAQWCAHKLPDEPVYETRRKISTGEYDFCLPEGKKPTDEQIANVLYGTKPDEEHPAKRGKRAVKEASKQTEYDPIKTNVIYEVYFRWPILTKEEAKSSTPTIELQELVGYYHERAEELLCCWQLGNWNGERQFVDFFMRQRPNSYSGTCTVEDVLPFQHYASNLFHLQIQNMVMRNLSLFFVRKGSSTANFLKGRKLKPGMVVEFDEPDDVKNLPLGTAIDSMSEEIAFLKSGAQEASLVTQYDTATAELTRVTAGAFAQQQNLSKLQPEMIYETFADAISRLALKYVQALIQYEPEQKLPEFDGKTDAIIQNVLHLPRQMVTDADFAFTVTATPTDETKDAEFQRDVQLAGQINNANEFLLSMLGTIMKPGTPPPFIMMGLRGIKRSEKILEVQIDNTRHDAKEFVISEKEMMDGILWLQQMQQQMQEQQQQQQPQGGEGGQGNIPNAGPGGAVPPAPGGPAGPAEVPAQLSGAGAGAPPAGQNLPS